MAHFSNGTEGAAYQAAYCEHCQHNSGGCVVWFAHLNFNSEQNKNPAVKEILEYFISSQSTQCRMFIPLESITGD